jgi:hypothetical protein
MFGKEMQTSERAWGIIKKHGIFLLENLVKKYPIWIGIKKITPSFWTSQFQHVHSDWGDFFD